MDPVCLPKLDSSSLRLVVKIVRARKVLKTNEKYANIDILAFRALGVYEQLLEPKQSKDFKMSNDVEWRRTRS